MQAEFLWPCWGRINIWDKNSRTLGGPYIWGGGLLSPHLKCALTKIQSPAAVALGFFLNGLFNPHCRRYTVCLNFVFSLITTSVLVSFMFLHRRIYQDAHPSPITFITVFDPPRINFTRFQKPSILHIKYIIYWEILYLRFFLIPYFSLQKRSAVESQNPRPDRNQHHSTERQSTTERRIRTYSRGYDFTQCCSPPT